jgi:hypothetical protein
MKTLTVILIDIEIVWLRLYFYVHFETEHLIPSVLISFMCTISDLRSLWSYFLLLDIKKERHNCDVI